MYNKEVAWSCPEFKSRVRIAIKESEVFPAFLLHSFAVKREFPSFDRKDCVFIDEDGRAFFPEPCGNFVTDDEAWYIKTPKIFYIYSNRRKKEKEDVNI